MKEKVSDKIIGLKKRDGRWLSIHSQTNMTVSEEEKKDKIIGLKKGMVLGCGFIPKQI